MKTCAKCKTEKDFSEFHVRKWKGKENYYSYCRTCEVIRVKEWGLKNPEKKRVAAHNASRPYLKHRKEYCERCGFVAEHRCQLDVDHIDGNHKNDDPTNLRTLCANCHRLKSRTHWMKESQEKTDWLQKIGFGQDKVIHYIHPNKG